MYTYLDHNDPTTGWKAIIKERGHSMIKVLIAETQPMVRKGLRMRLASEDDFLVVGEASDGLEVEKLMLETNPDVIILDADLTKRDGFTTTSSLRDANPEIGIILLSLRGDPALRAHAKKVGADAFIEKQEGVEKLMETIQQIRKTKGYQNA